ncbi:MAG: hypothetical protein NVSMB29_02350 [Candidatus Dormibacteria bacterium]
MIAAGRLSPRLGVGGVALAGTVGAVLLRAGMAQLLGPGSALVGLVFAAALVGLALCCGLDPERPSVSTLSVGIGGAAVLVGLPVLSRALHGVPLSPPTAPLGPAFAVWTGVVAVVGIAEELIFRGVLYSATVAAWGAAPSICVGAVAFGLLHVPFYGWGVLPVDMAAGLWLGALRASTGGVTAPATAHVLADWATWWLR